MATTVNHFRMDYSATEQRLFSKVGLLSLMQRWGDEEAFICSFVFRY